MILYDGKMEATVTELTSRSSFMPGDSVHDLNNMLCVLACGIELAHDQVAEPDALADILFELERAVNKALEINRQLGAQLSERPLAAAV